MATNPRPELVAKIAHRIDEAHALLWNLTDELHAGDADSETIRKWSNIRESVAVALYAIKEA